MFALNIAPRRVKDASRVAGDDRLGIDTVRNQQSICGDVGGADAKQHNAYLVEGLANHLRGGKQPGEGDCSRALLIIMPDREGDSLTRLVEHRKAFWL